MSRSPTPRSLQPDYTISHLLSHVYNVYTHNTPSTSQNSTQRKHPITWMDSCHHHHHGPSIIKKGESLDQKCNAQYLFQDDQWFNLTAQDMRITLVNAGIRYHRPQIIPGTPLPNSTSPPSPAPMKSSIHLECTLCGPVSVTPQTTCNFDTESLPEFKGLLDNTNQEPTDTPSTIPTAFQVSCDYSLHPECTHNLMAIQCNQYPNPSHNSALPQLLAHTNCEDLDPTETPSAVPTALQAPSDDTYNPRCAHNPMQAIPVPHLDEAKLYP